MEKYMQIYTQQEAAKRLGVSKTQIGLLRAKGFLPRGTVRTESGIDFYCDEDLPRLVAALNEYHDWLEMGQPSRA